MTKLFNQDFSERSQDKVPELSIMDKRFMDMVTTSTQLVDGHYHIPLPLRDRDK